MVRWGYVYRYFKFLCGFIFPLRVFWTKVMDFEMSERHRYSLGKYVLYVPNVCLLQ